MSEQVFPTHFDELRVAVRSCSYTTDAEGRRIARVLVGEVGDLKVAQLVRFALGDMQHFGPVVRLEDDMVWVACLRFGVAPPDSPDAAPQNMLVRPTQVGFGGSYDLRPNNLRKLREREA